MSGEREDTATARKRAEQGHENWAPYCLMCSTMARMVERPYGFQCDPDYVEPPIFVGNQMLRGRRGCGNKIDFDFRHYEEPSAAAGDRS